jgi:hypothetical protein
MRKLSLVHPANGNGFTIRLNALTLTGEIVIRKPKSDENGGAQ